MKRLKRDGMKTVRLLRVRRIRIEKEGAVVQQPQKKTVSKGPFFCDPNAPYRNRMLRTIIRY